MQNSASGGTHFIFSANEDDDYPGTYARALTSNIGVISCYRHPPSGLIL